MSKIAKIYEQVKQCVDTHDGDAEVEPYKRCLKNMKARGVQMAWADMERLGLEEDEVLYPAKSIKVSAGGQYGNIRVICPCEENVWTKEKDSEARHDNELTEVRVVADDRELVPA